MRGPRVYLAAGLLAIGVARLTPAEAAFVVEPWPLPPMTAPSTQPDLVATPDGRWLLAWTEKRADGAHALRVARTQNADAMATWGVTRTIAEGKDWFVNWADTPHVIALDDGTLWAHWLRRNGSGTYDYGIALVRSADAGATWSAPIRVEPQGARNDYGFVSMWQHAPGTLGLAWLDSRQKPAPAGDHAAHGHDTHGDARMRLRAATFSARGKRTIEWPLDTSTCDCCTTAVARTARGPVLVYRGRAEGEIRDTRLVRFEDGTWTRPRDVHVDGWKFAGCPVNGPAVAARDETVWVAWYTEAEDKPSLRLARSDDSGDTFASPRAVAEGEGVLGRAVLAIDASHVWLAWLEERDGGREGQQLWLARIDARSGDVIDRQVVAELAARGRASGLPRLQARDGRAALVWTDLVDSAPVLRGATIR